MPTFRSWHPVCQSLPRSREPSRTLRATLAPPFYSPRRLCGQPAPSAWMESAGFLAFPARSAILGSSSCSHRPPRRRKIDVPAEALLVARVYRVRHRDLSPVSDELSGTARAARSTAPLSQPLVPPGLHRGQRRTPARPRRRNLPGSGPTERFGGRPGPDPAGRGSGPTGPSTSHLARPGFESRDRPGAAGRGRTRRRPGTAVLDAAAARAPAGGREQCPRRPSRPAADAAASSPSGTPTRRPATEGPRDGG